MILLLFLLTVFIYLFELSLIVNKILVHVVLNNKKKMNKTNLE